MSKPLKPVGVKVRMLPALKRRAKKYADNCGWSLNTFIVRAIQDRVFQYEAAEAQIKGKPMTVQSYPSSTGATMPSNMSTLLERTKQEGPCK